MAVTSRLLEVRHARVPGVDLEDAGLGEGDVYVPVPELQMSFCFGSDDYERRSELPDLAKVTAVLPLPPPDIDASEPLPRPSQTPQL